MKKRTFIFETNTHSFEVEVYRFGNKSFYYPSFNGDQEFPCTAKGFRDLSSYLRTTVYLQNQYKQLKSELYEQF
jgi:hypothetical protein